MIIVDASVLTDALTDDSPLGEVCRSELGRDMHWAAPEHLIVETYSAVRGKYLGRKVSEQRAADAVAALRSITIELISVSPLLPRMWELRENLTGYDAAYIAAAEMHDCPLVTADARIARVAGISCELRLIG